MKDLVIYYSWTGHTKTVASVIAEAVNGELVEIEETKARKKGIGFIVAVFQGLCGLKSKIREVNFTPDRYNRLFLGTPIWAGKVTPAVNAYLANHSLTNKKIYLFFTLQDNNPPLKAIETLTKKIKQKGGQVYNVISIRTKMGEALKRDKVEVKVKEWLEKIL